MAKKYFKKEHEAIFNIITYHLTEDRMARLFEAVQGYKNHCVNAISDEEIEKHFEPNLILHVDNNKRFKESIDRILGAKWFRKKLLKK